MWTSLVLSFFVNENLHQAKLSEEKSHTTSDFVMYSNVWLVDAVSF